MLKAKLNLSGPRATMISGATALPSEWPREENLYLKLGTVYEQTKASGLLLEIVAIEIGQQQEVKKWNPFQRK